jgi:H+/Cl- antiporter ClcA
VMRSRRFLVLLALAAVVGVVASVAAWGFLELVAQTQQGVYDDLPGKLGFDHTPLWWPVPIVAIAGVIVAFAITRLPGNGGHIPANGLSAGVTQPVELPGVMLAGLAGIALGLVVGPEAPLIALGGGLGLLAVRLLGRAAAPEVGLILSASATFAALSLIFSSPLVAAVILIEVTGLGGPRLPLILVPGLLAAGIGSLISIGLGSWTGLSSSAYALGALPLPAFARPDIVDFAWTVPLAMGVAIATVAIFRLARVAEGIAVPRPFVVLPAAALLVAGLAIAFTELTDKGTSEVLFSGQDALPGLIAGAGSWSLSALALLIAFKGLAYGVSLGCFRGGPTFPAIFLGAAAGLMAGQLPGYEVTPAVAVGIGAAVVSVLRIPLSAVVLAVLLTATTGVGSGPLIIVGVVVAYLTTLVLSPPPTAPAAVAQPPSAAPRPLAGNPAG